MPVPTVASLSTGLGGDLAPLPGFTAPDTPVSAVHISELADPTAYLSGGELLLTTGLALPVGRIGCETYVGRLVRHGLAALGFGLGPAHDRVPDELVEACRRGGLPLLVVPAPTPFLRVSKAYWEALSRSSERELHDALAAHRGLVDAAASPDPTSTVLRRLSRAVDGWSALLGPTGDVDQIFPAGMVQEAESLRSEVDRLEVAGAHSAASFAVAGRFVVLFPLAVESRVVGYLAVGTPAQLDAGGRRLVLTACALLAIDAVRRTRSESARDAARRCVVTLVDLGHVEAARALAGDLGAPALPAVARVLAVRGRDAEALVHRVATWAPEAYAVPLDRSAAWLLLPGHHAPVTDLRAALAADPAASAVLSSRVRLDDVGRVRQGLLDRLAALPDGRLDLADDGPADVEQRLDRLVADARPGVVESLAAYLRHRGQWEAAARSLGLHRNTLRYRVAAVRDTWGLDLDDPDVAARLWLLLRERALA
jgi:PucR family transcriptional regulator, purine catabolism regulatory protein